jgi:conjugative relaxase-like TrwC/TraI family protein
MLRITQQSQAAGAKSYFAQPDYYTEGQELAGHWGGSGARLLGLEGQVEQEQFHALCDNQRPDQTGMLTGRTRTQRTVGYDWTFNAPKSVSLVHALTGDEALLKAFEDAVQETMDEAEAGMQTRVRKGGREANRTTGNMTWARFTHLTGRPVDGLPDPHLHAHVFVFNATYDPVEEDWKAGQFQGLKRDARYYEAAFHARLSGKLAELGYGIERTKTGWEIAGVPEATLKAFSRRTHYIERMAAEKGITDPEAKSQLGAKSREHKQKDLTMPELRQVWGARLSEAERATFDVLAAARQDKTEPPILLELAEPQAEPTPVGEGGLHPAVASDPITLAVAKPSLTPAQAMEWAIEHAFAHKAVVSEKQLVATALRRGMGSLSVAEAWQELDGHGILRRQDGEDRFVTTRQILQEERAMVGFARHGRGTCPALGKTGATLKRSWLTADQTRAARHVLDSFDRVILIRGSAGTGKTTMMQEAIEGIQAGGKSVVVLAPSIEASRGVLRREGFTEADTVAKFLLDEEFQRKALNQVIWVDEAGLISGRQMHQLFEVAKNLGARVVLSGDPRQHKSVERGDVLRQLQLHAGLHVPELLDIKRQKGLYRDAVAQFSEGNTAAGLSILEELNWIKALEDGEREKQLAADYVAALEEGKTVLAVSPTHAEAEAVAEAIRDQLKQSGKLTGEEREFGTWKAAHLTQAEQRDAQFFRQGDLLQFHKRTGRYQSGSRLIHDGQVALPLDQPDAFQVFRPTTLRLAVGDRVRITAKGTTRDKKHRLNHGSTYNVAGFTPGGDIRLSNGWVIGQDFGHLTHAYVVTSWASQGTTVDRVFIAQSSRSFAASSREQFYVSASRARESLTLYTDTLDGLRDAVDQADHRTTAMELIQDRPMEWIRQRLSHFRRWLNGPTRPRIVAPQEPRKELIHD